ncbi:MAG: hypothetical protein QM803_12000 [Rhodocyclaceae bacterium]
MLEEVDELDALDVLDELDVLETDDELLDAPDDESSPSSLPQAGNTQTSVPASNTGVNRFNIDNSSLEIPLCRMCANLRRMDIRIWANGSE